MQSINYHLHAVEALVYRKYKNVQNKCAAKQLECLIYTYK